MQPRIARFARDAALILVGGCLVAGTAVAGSMITGADVKDGSLTGKDVKDHSLTPRDFRGSTTGPAGKAGDQGPPGPQGEPGSAGGAPETELIQKATETEKTTPKELVVDCPNGPVLSGGFVLHSSEVEGQNNLRAVRSYALDSDSWLVRAIDDSASTSWQLTVVAVCAK